MKRDRKCTGKQLPILGTYEMVKMAKRWIMVKTMIFRILARTIPFAYYTYIQDIYENWQKKLLLFRLNMFLCSFFHLLSHQHEMRERGEWALQNFPPKRKTNAD